METISLFTAALGLSDPWKVTNVEFKSIEGSDRKELHLTIDFDKGSTFKCPHEECDKFYTAYDVTKKTWRHLNFFQYKTYIHARVPRIKCEKHGVHMVNVPWARLGSGFTLLFESFVVELAKHLPVNVIASMIDEHDTRLWRFIKHYVNEARKLQNYRDIKAIGMDETSKKGHNYITVMADLEEKNVIYVAEGKDSSTVDMFAAAFKEHNGNPDDVKIITCDMSLGFKKGINDNFKNCATIIDKFHIIKHANEAVDKVRKEETKNHQILKGTKYIWLKNPDKLNDAQKVKKEVLARQKVKTARAYAMRLALQDIYEISSNRKEAEDSLKQLCSWMMHSRIEQMKAFAKTLRKHWNDILNYFDYRYTNAILEGINSIIQNIKRRARGFKNIEYFKTMIYLTCGNLNLETVLNPKIV